jgi:hypothetical protein
MFAACRAAAALAGFVANAFFEQWRMPDAGVGGAGPEERDAEYRRTKETPGEMTQMLQVAESERALARQELSESLHSWQFVNSFKPVEVQPPSGDYWTQFQSDIYEGDPRVYGQIRQVELVSMDSAPATVPSRAFYVGLYASMKGARWRAQVLKSSKGRKNFDFDEPGARQARVRGASGDCIRLPGLAVGDRLRIVVPVQDSQSSPGKKGPHDLAVWVKPLGRVLGKGDKEAKPDE